MSKEDGLNLLGRFTKAEEKYIRENYQTVSIKEISENLKRNQDTVKQYIKNKILKLDVSEHEAIAKKVEFDIKKSPIWAELIQQFSENEQDIFIYNWTSVMAQFKHDVLPTERMQVIDMCRNEILLNRSLKRMNQISLLIDRFQEELKNEKAKSVQDRNVGRMIDLERTIAESMASSTNFTKEYKELLEKKNATLKDLKATRMDRIKRIEDSRENVTTWFSEVTSNTEYRRQLAIEAEKFRLAMDVELKRLSEYHQFGDSLEQPILNADTIKDCNI